MHLDFGLRLTQEQKLIMTTEMQLSIKLLQMSSYELLQHINNEVQENIVLEYANSSEAASNDNNTKKDLFDYKEMIKYLEFDNYGGKNYITNNYVEEISPFTFIGNKSTLSDYLKEQLVESNIDYKKNMICSYLVDNLDGKGYLTLDLNVVCKELSISMDLCELCLSIIQQLDPCGIGARNLSECLLIQIKRKGLYNDDLEEIISSHLQLLSENKYTLIAKKLKISPMQVQKYGDLIKGLEPKPSRGFYTGDEISYILPDAYIKKVNDEYLVLMNEEIVPKLNINSIYKEIINSSDDKVAVEYVKEKINNAMFLIKSVDNRKRTLYRVISEIINYQRDYFDYGEEYIKPMTIKNISGKLNLHESTVSRAIRDKYISLNSGRIIKIKDLFTTAINISSEQLSNQNIKRIIKEIIQEEDEKKPLSDSSIRSVLLSRGLDISRRTIAKYRDEMGIKPSSQRKRF